MNKISNQFSSIEQITDQYLKHGSTDSASSVSELSFEDILRRRQSVDENSALIFQTRLHAAAEQKYQAFQ